MWGVLEDHGVCEVIWVSRIVGITLSLYLGSLLSSGYLLTSSLPFRFWLNSSVPPTVMGSTPHGPSRSTVRSAGAVTRTLTSTSTAPARATWRALVMTPRCVAAPTRSTLTSSVSTSPYVHRQCASQCLLLCFLCPPITFF